jgi:Tfp pilus assembly protein PilF
MNRPLQPCRVGTLTVLLGLAGFAGCLHFDLPSRPELTVADSTLNASKVKPRQVADVHVALGRSLEKQGEAAQAMAAYKEALRLDPSRADAGLRLAILYDKEGKFKESLPLYQKALAAYPGNPDIFCDMGYSLYLQRRFGEAEINLRQALALAPEHVRAHNNLGLVLAHSGRPEEAVGEFRRAGCTDADAQINLAFALTLENNWAEAGKRYEMALAIDSSSTAARKGLQELDSVVARANQVGPTSASNKSASPGAQQGKPSLTHLSARNQDPNPAN